MNSISIGSQVLPALLVRDMRETIAFYEILGCRSRLQRYVLRVSRERSGSGARVEGEGGVRLGSGSRGVRMNEFGVQDPNGCFLAFTQPV